jgi:hypothetical protein
MNRGKIFNRLIEKRKDSVDLISCMENTVIKLLENETSLNKPGILLGKIQSGKTRAFIGILGLVFDNDYDVSIILTKGTKALLKQTVQRMEKDFAEFIEEDIVEVFDIMYMPDNLTKFERKKKLIIIVKKEVNNMNKILEKLASVYPDLREKRILIIDDEADFASISFRKQYAEAVEVGRISSQIDELRNIVEELDYLQVTATPYSLYLQPNTIEESMEFLPKRPAFTVLVPIHDAYIGGKFYFEESKEENNIAANIYEEVSVDERDILKQQDARKLKISEVLISDKISVLRKAIINFIVGSIIRRVQQEVKNENIKKYAFIAHSEIGKKSHEWQSEIIEELIKQLTVAAKKNDEKFESLIKDSYKDLEKSIKKINIEIPLENIIVEKVKEALIEEQLVTVVVNGNTNIEELLNNDGQLKLRNPMNIFIGGQILDRGVTINNLIGFYYGRSPKRFQQDTVLQHSRMYGARPYDDLAVTRFYTTRDIYEVMSKIHDFDTALRDTFEKGNPDKKIYFIRKDVTGKLAPCSPNKLLLSSLETLRPYRRMLPVGFQTGYKTHIENTINEIDKKVHSWFHNKDNKNSILVELSEVINVINLIKKTLELNNQYSWNWDTFISSLEHLSSRSCNPLEKGKVWIIIREDRNISREREFRFSNVPDNETDAKLARETAINTPCLQLLRQNGLKENGWRDTPFWWPILVAPANTEVTIFAEDTI